VNSGPDGRRHRPRQQAGIGQGRPLRSQPDPQLPPPSLLPATAASVVAPAPQHWGPSLCHPIAAHPPTDTSDGSLGPTTAIWVGPSADEQQLINAVRLQTGLRARKAAAFTPRRPSSPPKKVPWGSTGHGSSQLSSPPLSPWLLLAGV